MLVWLCGLGCVRSYAAGTLADAISGSGSTYASDDDPELIEAAVPFGLKTMEGVLEVQPEHLKLLLALASGFTSYSYGFVESAADEIAATNIDQALILRKRAHNLYGRGRTYGLRGLEVAHPGFTELFAKNRQEALLQLKAEDVPLLYWSAAAWALSINTAKDDPEELASLVDVTSLAERALALDESWNQGTLHEFFITYEMAKPDGSVDRAKAHFERAVALSKGLRVGPYVDYAESIAIKTQNLREFKAMLAKALAIDTSKKSPDRLQNVLLQRRARRLLNQVEDLFLDVDEKS